QLISSDTAREVYLGYATYQVSFPLPVSKDGALAWTLDFFTDYVLGVFGIMIAILVTASSIPRTYEAGAVDLLLSKPLSRSGVFLTNFVGGCAFILLITSYLIIGMWLIGGLRHGYWNQRFLLCIPLLLFLFAIYYSVSALIGVIWKNAIVSIFVTVAFWCFCFLMWMVKSGVETTIMDPQRLIRLVAVDDTLLATNQGFGFGANRQTKIWGEDTQTWRPVLAPSSAPAGRGGFTISTASAPVFDPHKKRLLIIDMAGDVIATADDETTTNRCLFVGDESGDWNRTMWAYVPDDVMNVFVTHDGRYILVGATGIYEVSSTREVAKQAKQIDAKEGVNDLNRPISNSFSAIGPDNWSPYGAVSMNSHTAALAVLRGQNLTIYELDQDGHYNQQSSTELEADNAQLIAFGDSAIGISFGDGHVAVHDAKTLKLRETYQPFEENRVVQLKAAPDGRWLAAVFEHRRLWLYDGSNNTASEPDVENQGDVSAIAFTSQGGLAVATNFDHVKQYDPESLATLRLFHPSLETGPRIYWYLVRPIYSIFPKPGELGDVVTYLVTEKRTSSDAAQGSQPVVKQLNIWQPLLSNVAFLSVVLALACLYVHRKDF
ncbi:MAG: ABC transporter permease subunit, partial [Planctomycetaceae bacterium]|nr:ABC transporter permease subunit [Planctomycetaceae bacterium]